jgi:membrane associated rhomboid family serine protease
VIVFYACEFPQAKLGLFLRYFVYFRWVQFPAWAALALWLLLQTITLVSQLMGLGSVAATAHLGGAAAGFGFWLLWRKLQPSTAR